MTLEFIQDGKQSIKKIIKRIGIDLERRGHIEITLETHCCLNMDHCILHQDFTVYAFPSEP